MPNIMATKKEIDQGLLKIFIIISSLFLCVSTLNIFKTDWVEWKPRPSVECDNGDSVHRFVYINANRVNIRDLPTVFSTVLSQKNKNDEATIICEFGVWSRINEPNIESEKWISSGLITAQRNQPLSARTKIILLSLFIFGSTGLIICQLKPRWIYSAVNLILQTQELPAHAKPLISATQEFSVARER